MSAISGTRRQIRELVDGSLEVRIHIDPRFKAEFHRLFPNIDVPVAIAPLVNDFERREPESAKGGPLARLAGIWCKDSEFLQWLTVTEKAMFQEDDAAEWIRETCGVESRAQLDNDKIAEDIFQAKIREPYMNWIKKREE